MLAYWGEGFSSGQWAAFWAGVTAIATVVIAVGAVMFGLAELKMARDRDEDLRLRRESDRAQAEREKQIALEAQAAMMRGRYKGYRTSQHLNEHVWEFTNFGDVAWPTAVLFFAYDSGTKYDSKQWTPLLDVAAREMGVELPVAAWTVGPVPSGSAVSKEAVISGPFFPSAAVLLLVTADGQRLWTPVDTSRAEELRPPR